MLASLPGTWLRSGRSRPSTPDGAPPGLSSAELRRALAGESQWLWTQRVAPLFAEPHVGPLPLAGVASRAAFQARAAGATTEDLKVLEWRLQRAANTLNAEAFDGLFDAGRYDSVLRDTEPG